MAISRVSSGPGRTLLPWAKLRPWRRHMTEGLPIDVDDHSGHILCQQKRAVAGLFPVNQRMLFFVSALNASPFSCVASKQIRKLSLVKQEDGLADPADSIAECPSHLPFWNLQKWQCSMSSHQ